MLNAKTIGPFSRKIAPQTGIHFCQIHPNAITSLLSNSHSTRQPFEHSCSSNFTISIACKDENNKLGRRRVIEMAPIYQWRTRLIIRTDMRTWLTKLHANSVNLILTNSHGNTSLVPIDQLNF